MARICCSKVAVWAGTQKTRCCVTVATLKATIEAALHAGGMKMARRPRSILVQVDFSAHSQAHTFDQAKFTKQLKTRASHRALLGGHGDGKFENHGPSRE